MAGFFGPTEEFDDFLAKFVTPPMVDAGFKRAKRVYRLTDHRASVVVQMRLYIPAPDVAFHVEWAAVPAVLGDFFATGKKSWRPGLSKGLNHSRLTMPDAWNTSVARYASMYRYFDGSTSPNEERTQLGLLPLATFGPRFQTFLVEVAIPKWKRALEPDYLLGDEFHSDVDVQLAGPASRYHSKLWAAAILGADAGDTAASAAAIDEVVAERPQDRSDPIIPWLRQRLAERMIRERSAQ